ATTTSESSEGSDPTVTSHRLRNTIKRSGRMSASDPTVLPMLSRLTTASVSTAIRWPPAKSTSSGGSGSSSWFSRAAAAVACRDRRRHAAGAQPAERLLERASAQQQQFVIGEPSEIPRAVDDAGIDARDLGRVAERRRPRANLVRVVGDAAALGRGEHDVELIEAAEARQKRTERIDHAVVARQKRQHVRIERQAP